MAYETPTHLGRFQAASPFYSKESLDSRRGGPIDGYAELLRDNQLVIADYTTIDTRGSTVPADDQADGDSDYGAFHVGGE